MFKTANYNKFLMYSFPNLSYNCVFQNTYIIFLTNVTIYRKSLSTSYMAPTIKFSRNAFCKLLKNCGCHNWYFFCSDKSFLGIVTHFGIWGIIWINIKISNKITLSISVRKAVLSTDHISPQANFYVTLKLQHVKSTTVPVKGPLPSWEQDFLL